GARLDLFREGHMQPFCDYREGGALEEYGGDGDKEHDIENGIRFFYAGQQWVSGKHDGHGAAQSHPGYVQPSAHFHVKKCEAYKDGYGPGHEDQEKGDHQAQPDIGHDGGGKHEEAEGEEEHNLHDPGEPVVHFHDGLFVYEVLVAQVHGANVDGKEA